MTQTMEINHEIEAMIAENQGHEIGCWETLTEIALERLAERGATWQCGASTEVVAGRTVTEWAVELEIGEPDLCTCSRQYVEIYAQV